MSLLVLIRPVVLFALTVTTTSVLRAQPSSACSDKGRVEGTITDSTGALLPGAEAKIDSAHSVKSDSAGYYVIACIAPGARSLAVTASGFSPQTARVVFRRGRTTRLDLKLGVEQVSSQVEVQATSTEGDPGAGVGTTTLNGVQIQQLADDPDDFLRQLQLLGGNVGGSDGATVIVDGFRSAGTLPPKSAISSIRLNPDIFVPEYQSPPWRGATIEIFTKPGLDNYHGALFLTNSNGVFNATNPLSSTTTPAGKQRYGFELSGPIVRQRSDFSLALEHRAIDEFNVVNAVGINAQGNQTSVRDTVSAPQRLWIGSARGDWQVSPRDLATISFSSNVNNLGNQGVGGLVLRDSGYSSTVSEHDLRFTNSQPLSASFLHETRIGYSWKRTEDIPSATNTSLQISGAFTSGGSTLQRLNNRERDLEIDDDAMLTHGKHQLRYGVQSLGQFVHEDTQNTFNGAYIFGGGSGPELDVNNQPTGQTIYLSPLQQYQRALAGLPGGRPTTYQITNGSPLVAFTQWTVGLFAQDIIQVAPRFTLSAGLRYQLQTSPTNVGDVLPRLGLAWSPDKKQTWTVHARAGLFASPVDISFVADAYRLNGVRQQSLMVYSPEYGYPLIPVTGSIAVDSINRLASNAHQVPSLALSASVEHDFSHHWHVQLWALDALVWGAYRIRNINAPEVASEVGTPPDPISAVMAARPFTPNQNVFQYENSGHLKGPIVGGSITQQSYKHFGFTGSYKFQNVRADVADSINSPQSAYTNAGESSHIEWSHRSQFDFTGFALLPFKINLSSVLDARNGGRYNFTTGTDNNGDGIFNDRPSFAVDASQANTFQTKYGLMTTDTINGNVQRNLGMMPGTIHLDLNAARVFPLPSKQNQAPKTMTFNVRSANVLNHTNVLTVGTVVSSSNLGKPVTADTARRIELGLRFSF